MFTLSVITMIGWVMGLVQLIIKLTIQVWQPGSSHQVGEDRDHDVRPVWDPCLYPLLQEHGQGGVRHNSQIFVQIFQVFANIFKWLYRQMLACGNRRKALEKYDVMEEDMEDLDAMPHEEEVNMKNKSTELDIIYVFRF